MVIKLGERSSEESFAIIASCCYSRTVWVIHQHSAAHHTAPCWLLITVRSVSVGDGRCRHTLVAHTWRPMGIPPRNTLLRENSDSTFRRHVINGAVVTVAPRYCYCHCCCYCYVSLAVVLRFVIPFATLVVLIELLNIECLFIAYSCAAAACVCIKLTSAGNVNVWW